MNSVIRGYGQSLDLRGYGRFLNEVYTRLKRLWALMLLTRVQFYVNETFIKSHFFWKRNGMEWNGMEWTPRPCLDPAEKAATPRCLVVMARWAIIQRLYPGKGSSACARTQCRLFAPHDSNQPLTTTFT